MPSGRSRGRSQKRQHPLGILPLDAHLELAATARYDRYRLDPRAQVRNEKAFAEMKAHLNDLYQGVNPVHSFEDPAGAVVDCVPIERQPSLRRHRGAIPVAPDLRPLLQGQPAEPISVALEQVPEELRIDRHGNRMQAPPGTIPMRRVTLDELARFEDLRSFFRKQPGPVQVGPSAPDADVSKNHRYAYTQQAVDTVGAHSALALYAPSIDSNQVFSLSQHWYAGGSGTGHQTLELGWQVFPGKYGHASPVFFIYWTADNYGSTGAYNLDQPGFVQTNSSVTIGGALSPVSVQGRQQMEVEVAVYLFNGNWWLYFGGITAANAIGYYPTSLYSGGQMASNATEILFGGETVTRAVSWPGMGSGAFASAGWQQAAYQRDIYYYPPGGGSQWTSLTPFQPSPGCYTLDLGSAPSPWGVYFFYGGSGGGDC